MHSLFLNWKKKTDQIILIDGFSLVGKSLLKSVDYILEWKMTKVLNQLYQSISELPTNFQLLALKSAYD